jgi:hypothetical protein
MIFIVEVDDLDLVTVDAKRHPPVLGHEQAPGSLPVAGQLMRFQLGTLLSSSSRSIS